MINCMNYSEYEKLAIDELRKEVDYSINEGFLSKGFLKSNLYYKCEHFLQFIINILAPISDQEIKELSLMAFKAFVFIKAKNEALDNDINSTWDKYRETFLINFKVRIGEIIKYGYIGYELQETTLTIGDGLTVPLNPKAFTEMYQAIDPVGFPKCYKEYISAMKKIERNLRDSTHPEAPEIVNSEYTVKSVCNAYFYMYKKGIYPIPELVEAGKKLLFYRKLADTYKLSYFSFRTDWKPLEDKEKRIAKPESIKLAIKLLETIDNPKIKESIELANSELKEAELKT